MLRFLEIALFVLPFATFALWRFAGGGPPSTVLVTSAAGAALILAAALLWFASFDTLGPGQSYVPARLENGQIVPGHAAGG